MPSSHSAVALTKLAMVSAIILSTFTGNITRAQSSDTDQNHHRPPNPQNLSTQSLPENPPELNRPSRIIHRIGTAIAAPRNSISIKSTDAGLIRRQPPMSGCINCGIVDFVNKIGQGPGLNAIAGGVVAGTVAREIIRQIPHAQGITHPGMIGGTLGGYGRNMVHPDNPYQIGITMSDGSQAIIALPDASNLQQGDRVRLIDGALVLDRE